MIPLWIVLGYLACALLAFRFWSMPMYRKKYLAAQRLWDARHDRGMYAGETPFLGFYVLGAFWLAMAWPGPALYKLLWPRGIDYKMEKEKLKEKLKKDAEAAVKEAERIAKEYGLRNPKD